jgi:putative intracellular protease/amidase
MKLALFCFLLSLGIFFPANMELQAQESKKVLLFIRDGSGDLDYTLKNEVCLMINILKESGFTVVIATVSGEPLLTDSIEITPDLKLIDVVVADYSGFILPCMHAGFSAEEVDQQAEIMVKEAILAEKPIAVQHAAIIILAKSGVLQGIRYTFHVEVDVSKYPEFKGSIYSGTGVVQDGNIISSGIDPYLAERYRLEDGTKELTRLFIDVINK